MMQNPVVFSVLTTAGSPGPLAVLGHLADAGLRPHTIYVYHPPFKANLRRVVRKLRTAGLRATAERIIQTLLHARRRAPAQAQAEAPARRGYADFAAHVVDVPHFRSDGLILHARANPPDVFLAMTDEIIGRSVFSIPRFGTLNAHPGYNPTYRGLSATERMLRDGVPPVVTVHCIDEGIDTGPIIASIPVRGPVVEGGKIDDSAINRAQADSFIHALTQFDPHKGWDFIDRFTEVSNVSAPLTAAEIEGILQSRAS